MEAYAAVSEEMEPPSEGSPRDVLQSVPMLPEAVAEDESLESLRDALSAARLRLAYFEHFGGWVEEQMAAVVERASSLERESEHQRAETSEDVARQRAETDQELARLRSETNEEITRLRDEVAEEVAGIRHEAKREREEVAAEIAMRRQELEELQAECERRREEARATIAHAHATAEFITGRLSESASGIVQRALADLETLRSELTPEGLVAAAMSVPVPAHDEGAESEDRQRGWLSLGK